MAIRIAHMKIAFAPMSHCVGFLDESPFPLGLPRNGQHQKREKSAAPTGSWRCHVRGSGCVPVFCAKRCEIGAFATVDDLKSQEIIVEANGRLHVRNPKGNCRNLFNHR